MARSMLLAALLALLIQGGLRARAFKDKEFKVRARMRFPLDARTLARSHARTHARTHARMLLSASSSVVACKHALTHASAHTGTHAHAHAHTRTTNAA